jgi:hypothetical protein
MREVADGREGTEESRRTVPLSLSGEDGLARRVGHGRLERVRLSRDVSLSRVVDLQAPTVRANEPITSAVDSLSSDQGSRRKKTHGREKAGRRLDVAGVGNLHVGRAGDQTVDSQTGESDEELFGLAGRKLDADGGVSVLLDCNNQGPSESAISF